MNNSIIKLFALIGLIVFVLVLCSCQGSCSYKPGIKDDTLAKIDSLEMEKSIRTFIAGYNSGQLEAYREQLCIISEHPYNGIAKREYRVMLFIKQMGYDTSFVRLANE